jgi:hypothetical protein
MLLGSKNTLMILHPLLLSHDQIKIDQMKIGSKIEDNQQT